MDHESYATLGLVHTLNPIASGGSEQLLPRISPVILVGSGNITDTPDFNATRKGFGRILRDEAGKVVQVTLNPEDTEDRLKDSSEVMREPENTQNAREKWVTNLGKQNDGTSRLEKYVTVEGTLFFQYSEGALSGHAVSTAALVCAESVGFSIKKKEFSLNSAYCVRAGVPLLIWS